MKKLYKVLFRATNSAGSTFTSSIPINIRSANSAIYVASDGNDNANGSKAEPYATLAKAAKEAQPGGTIYLNRGDTWREVLTLATDGITVSAYGAGDLPAISGADEVSRLSAQEGGAEGTGQIRDVNFETGDLSELGGTTAQGSCNIAYSEAQARSGAGSVALTSDTNDRRVHANLTGLTAIANGETVHIFFAIYTPTGSLDTSGSWKLAQTNASSIALEIGISGGVPVTIKGNDYSVNNGATQINPSVISWNMDAWNTIEWSYTKGASGGQEVWVNGALAGQTTGDTSAVGNLTTIYLGNRGFGGGPAANSTFYFDDIKVSYDAPHMAARLGGGNADIWEGTFATEPRQLIVNGQRGRRRATVGEVSGHRDWHWASGNLIVCGQGEAKPTVEASVRDDLVTINGTSAVTISNLALKAAGRRAVEADTANGFIVEDCEIDDAYVVGINSSNQINRTGVRIRRNTVRRAGQMGIGFGGRLADWIIEDNNLNDCGRFNKDDEVLPAGWNAFLFEWTGGLKNWGWGGAGWQGAYEVRNNVVTGSTPLPYGTNARNSNGIGIWLDEVLEPTARPKIYGNTVANCYSRGVYLEKCDNHDVYENLIYRCATAQYCASLEIQSNPYGYDVDLGWPDNMASRQVSGSTFMNNTVVGGWWSLSVACTYAGCSISDTIVQNNICVGLEGSSAELYIAGGGANDGTHGTGNTYKNNCFGPEGGGWVWGRNVYRTLTAFEGVTSGAASDNLAIAPHFTNETSDDYTLQVWSAPIGSSGFQPYSA